ncbi:voltage-gated potassium channel [Acetitomaculum ruminis DSM 5522]|uniref:Voltage-gated potassium channel n=1 Tax=Acetitomaculum ruminis DSM 5522 TaxID=1120918 RepID=A0A1I0ZR55_9FIRM|nr:ion transporter [Acetitomaculum ruminis]SFB28269.1 voltage-gated potassium channel [Acetitomaculum ruminis DSM 5522]
MKKKIFDIIQISDKSNIVSRAFDLTLVIIIFTNIGVMFLETFSELYLYKALFKKIEFWTTMFFLMEYILRIWTADYLYPKTDKIKARLKFLISFDGIIDLLTIIPTLYLTGFVAFRMLRVVRIFHLFRLNAQYDSFNVITSVIIEKKNQIASSIFIIMILMLAGSLCMYSAEHEAQPEVFNNAFSGIWWAVSTVLTVGYGDIYPITALGKFMAIIIAFLGVGAVAIPTGIISAGFVEEYTKDQHILNYSNLDSKDILEIKVEKNDDFCNKKIMEIKDIIIYLIIRDELSILPTPSLTLKKNDIIIFKKFN